MKQGIATKQNVPFTKTVQKNDGAATFKKLMGKLEKQNPDEVEFQQSVAEVLTAVLPYIEKHPKYAEQNLLERLIEPERVVTFRVPWVDDHGVVQVNRGWRVEFNSAIGPYKGGIRFAADANLDTMKFLAFEQIFKNALTSLPLGAGKGGADFDSIGKTDMEIMRFCQSYINELFRHIGENTDIPAGDLGVGAKEVGYMFGQYKRLKNEFSGTFTGKGITWGGSLLRPEATGYGVAYFIENMLAETNETLQGKLVAISGYGNVGSFLIEKLNELGAIVVTAADAEGYIYDPQGISGDKLTFLKDLWVKKRRPIKDYADKYGVKYIANGRPWEVPVDIAIPSSKQNELDAVDAKTLINNGVLCVCEASNMGSTNEAIQTFVDNHILFAPGMAANAGGVSVSGLEMSQNSLRYNWSREEVDQKLQDIMRRIHKECLVYGTEEQYVNYSKGASLAGFLKVADAMLEQGIV